MLRELIKKNRQRMADECPDIAIMQYLSPAMYIIVKQILPAIDLYCRGKLLDIGAGHMPLKRILENKVGPYDTLDVEARTGNVTFIGSVLDMHMIQAGVYDTAVSFAVLEHVPDPFRAVAEINRILKIDGYFLLSLPHVSRLHEIPHDYFRFTEFGIKALLEKNGFEIIELQRSGTLLSLLAHQISTVLIGLTWHIPVFNQFIFWLNKLLIVYPLSWIDMRFMKNSLTPMNYFCVARKIK
ncbi:MAG: class I SAM-dependent methyltransferase [Candidatus Omnitrophota bacterium]